MYRLRFDSLIGGLLGTVLIAMFLFGLLFTISYGKDVYELGFKTASVKKGILGVGLLTGCIALYLVLGLI